MKMAIQFNYWNRHLLFSLSFLALTTLLIRNYKVGLKGR